MVVLKSKTKRRDRWVNEGAILIVRLLNNGVGFCSKELLSKTHTGMGKSFGKFFQANLTQPGINQKQSPAERCFACRNAFKNRHATGIVHARGQF